VYRITVSRTPVKTYERPYQTLGRRPRGQPTFPETLETDRLRLERYCHDTATPVERYIDSHGGRYEGLLRHHSDRYDDPVDHHRFSIAREEYQPTSDDR